MGASARIICPTGHLASHFMPIVLPWPKQSGVIYFYHQQISVLSSQLTHLPQDILCDNTPSALNYGVIYFIFVYRSSAKYYFIDKIRSTMSYFTRDYPIFSAVINDLIMSNSQFMCVTPHFYQHIMQYLFLLDWEYCLLFCSTTHLCPQILDAFHTISPKSLPTAHFLATAHFFAL